ncbi:glycosyltransferase family 1 protein [Alisedimentitalea sp. MJ-SS2]|uniref:glycosyltransferase family 4 protein n=1 Tax=Aliisedimentitalea sp. MJ-SS2 TaxID=3049795 RepID=UPI002914AF23|nr:glycosyltransferase family 1 protein [Alisedimentitalea sp. MJ-SS2]MDU8927850.1 glycosyltransferase family 1 protein [Alisedimentitalea sp. MJ-SS2]
MTEIQTRLLDLTRLASRAGRGLTGVDRVELAYLNELIHRDDPAFGLLRSRIGFLLLDKTGMEGFARRVEGKLPWGQASRLSKVFGKLDEMQRRAISDARRLAVGRTHRRGLGRLLRRKMPKGFAYLNVGHSNLNDTVISAVKHAGKGRFVAMVHDTIPLDHPQYQTPASAARFKQMLKRVRAHADLVIYNSSATRRDAERHMQAWGALPQAVVAHLGVEMAEPAPEDLPNGLPPEEPYFVCVSTLEPRKNHALLLDIWERLAKLNPPQDMPHLVICGARGWMNEELLFRMDRSALMGEYLHEHEGLSDGAIAALLERAAGALYPSFVEGYGLPMIEAAARGVPVICEDLPVYREVLQDIPVYASLKDSYLWQRRITVLASDRQAGRKADPFDPPSWSQHFNKVFRLT